MHAGDSFFAPIPPDNGIHLFVIISDPQLDDSRIVVAPFMTSDSANDDEDTACPVSAGDHPFIRHPSYVNYYCAAAPSAQKIKQRRSRIGKPVSAALLQRIREGAAKSDSLAFELRKILEDQGLIDSE